MWDHATYPYPLAFLSYLYIPVPPDLLQPPPYQRVECAQSDDGDQQRDEEGPDHVVAEEVSQGVGRRHGYDDLLPVEGREGKLLLVVWGILNR